MLEHALSHRSKSRARRGLDGFACWLLIGLVCSPLTTAQNSASRQGSLSATDAPVRRSAAIAAPADPPTTQSRVDDAPLPQPNAEATDRSGDLTNDAQKDSGSARSTFIPSPLPATRGVQETLRAEIERGKSYLGELEALADARSVERQALVADLAEARQGLAELDGALQLHSPGDSAVISLLDDLTARIRARQPRLAAALAPTEASTALDPFDPGLQLEGLDGSTVAAEIEQLRDLLGTIEQRRLDLLEIQRALRIERIEGYADLVNRMYGLRTDALQRLPPEERQRRLGLSPSGFSEFQLEVERVRLEARADLQRGLGRIQRLRSQAQDPAWLASAVWLALKLLTLLIAYLWGRAQLPRIKRGLVAGLRPWTATRRSQVRLRRTVELLDRLYPPLLRLLAIGTLEWLLGNWAGTVELRLPLRLLWLYAWYRFVIDATYALSALLARQYRLAFDDRADDVQRTVRWIARVVFLILVLLGASSELLGRGYLYHRMVQFAWVIGILTFLLVIARWRPAIADAYVATGQEGRLMNAVRASRDRWHGFFIAVAAFLWLAGRALWTLGRDFVLGFDGSRRVLAFVFRRKMERQAERSGYADVPVAELPECFRRAFDEAVVDDEARLLDHFPGRDRLATMVESWKAGDSRGSFLLSGAKGVGKSTWLAQVRDDAVPVQAIRFDSRPLHKKRLAAVLAEGLGFAEENVDNLRALETLLKDAPPRIVTLDRMQNLFLSRVGGYDLIERLVALIETTSERVFWIGSITQFARDHLFAVHPELKIFRHHEALPPWREEQIGALIERRAASQGIALDFEALLAERPHRRVLEERMVETAEGYMRMIWDYSGGLPRVALHFWLRSLVPDGEQRARVKLFRPPDETEFSDLGQQAMFLVAAIMVHENLSIAEATSTTRYPVSVCRMHLERLADQQILSCTSGRYRLTTRWHRAVTRVLIRNNLLPD